ncbi:putative ATP-dependent RNA helicase TDRD9 [Folsomia candida]|uniref:Putative ATP-dependent RNA helicase TDRD9 n=1 Tax=Folsomia candida TaxID=158441 RepID=A0A226CXV7_FOLCA|nr:putative ATP-dependent RNA helicase TDRD9 [Folsomia candida]
MSSVALSTKQCVTNFFGHRMKCCIAGLGPIPGTAESTFKTHDAQMAFTIPVHRRDVMEINDTRDWINQLMKIDKFKYNDDCAIYRRQQFVSSLVVLMKREREVVTAPNFPAPTWDMASSENRWSVFDIFPPHKF